MNPARPLKRAAQPDGNDEQRDGSSVKVGRSYVQIEAKRRHTDDEDEGFGAGPSTARQVMQPPMRQSNFRKVRFHRSTLAGSPYLTTNERTLLPRRVTPHKATAPGLPCPTTSRWQLHSHTCLTSR